MVQLRESEELEREKQQVEKVLEEVEKLFPQVESIISGSDFGQDAVNKAHGVLEKAKEALTSPELAELDECKAALNRTLNMFKGVVAKTQLS